MFASPVRNGFSHIALPARVMRAAPRISAGNSPNNSSGPERCVTQFRMCQIQIVHPLHDMIGKLIGERESKAIRGAIRRDEVNPGEFRFLPAVERKLRRRQRLFRRDNAASVAFVKPLRLHADLSGFALPAFEAHAKHLHRIRCVRRVRLGVHLVARVRGAQMRKTGSGQENPRRIRMIDGRQYPAVLRARREDRRFPPVPRHRPNPSRSNWRRLPPAPRRERWSIP